MTHDVTRPAEIRAASVPATRLATQLAKDVVLPVLAFLAPLLALEAFQCSLFDCSLFLGWDSSTYAWWATLVQSRGAAAMILQWSYPHLYVLLLSGVSSLVGGISVAEHVLPLLVAIPLAWAYHHLTVRLTGNPRLGLLAAFLGGISVDTVYLVADLQRNLMAFGIALPLGASIYADLFARREPPPHLWRKAVLLWFPLLFIVLATQIETYVVLALSLLLAAFLTREVRACLRGIIVVAVPFAIAAPLISGLLTSYTSETSVLLPFGLADAIFGTWLYLSGFAIIVMGIGLVMLLRRARLRDPTANFLVLWLAALALLVPVALAIHIPPTRLLLVIPVPILLVLALPTVRRWVATALQHLRMPASASVQEGVVREDPRPAATNRPPAGLTLGIAVLLLVAPLAVTTITNKDQFLVPYVSQGAVGELGEAARIVQALGYSHAILVLYGPNSAFYSPIYRAYFGLRLPDNLAYYGTLQFLFNLADTGEIYPWKYAPTVEPTYSASYAHEIASTIGVSGIPSWPIVIAGEQSYPLPASEVFLGRFKQAPNIYVIPPGALTARDLDTWRLFAYADCYDCGLGIPRIANWSESQTILHYLNLGATPEFNASYVFYLRQSWASANFTFQFWDWPRGIGNGTNGIVNFAPLEVYLDGKLLVRHTYGGTGLMELAIPIVNTASGIHRINVRSGALGDWVVVDLDDMQFVPKP